MNNCSLGEADFTDKSDNRVGHLNTILARGDRNLNNSIFKSSNARGLLGGGGGCRSFDLIGTLFDNVCMRQYFGKENASLTRC